MADIVEFLTARLAEDEAVATADENSLCVVVASDEASDAFVERFDYRRMLAEVKAKRGRLALYVEVTDILFHGSSGNRIKYQRESGRFEALDLEVRRDAALYADHPDYNPAWRVE